MFLTHSIFVPLEDAILERFKARAFENIINLVLCIFDTILSWHKRDCIISNTDCKNWRACDADDAQQ